MTTRGRRGLAAWLGMRAVWMVCCGVAVLAAVIPGFSQGNAGRIVGSITDQTGGAIAGAMVTVTDVARGTSRTLTTDDSGEFNAPNLIPGTYKVHAEIKGFQATERQNITLEVNQELRVDLTLQPGEQTQTITVTEQLPLIETTNAELGGTIQNAVINNLPLNGRNFENLLTLRPGVTIYPGGGGWTQSTNGIRAHDNVYMVDGVNSNDPWMAQSIMNAAMAGGDAGTILPIDAIDEFKTEINPRAQYGWKPGAVVNVGIKSGTNALHGSAYAYGRDGSWDARNYFNPAPDPVGALALEQFGATLGGAVKKDKLFYFFSFEDQRYSVGNPAEHRVPVTNLTSTSTNSLVGACNAARTAGKLTALSAQLAGLSLACAPTSAFPGIFPANNSSSTTLSTTLNTTNQIDAGLAKVDYHLNEKNSFTASYFISPGNGIFVDNPVRELSSQWLTVQYARAQVFSTNWTFTPSSNVVNEARVGYSHYYQNFQSTDATNDPANYNLNGNIFHLYTGQTNPTYFGLPQIRVSGGLNVQMGLGWPKVVGPDSVLQLLDHVSLLRGKHSFMFGGEILDDRSTNNVTANTKGPLNFTSLTNFFTGTPQTAQFLTGNILRHMSFAGYAAFVQDDWHVKPRLTVNLGLRYEINTVPQERDNLLGNFDPQRGLVQVGSQIPSLYNGDHNNFSPRLGFAWDVTGNGKTVVRGGASIIYEQLSLDVFNNIANVLGSRTVPTGAALYECASATPGVNCNAKTGTTTGIVQVPSPGNINTVSTNQSATVTQNWPTNSAASPLYSNAAACGDGLAVPAGFASAPQPCEVVAVDRNFRTPYVATWTLGIQRAITNNLSLEVAYVGNHGAKLVSLVDANEPPAGAGWTTAAVNTCLATLNCAPDTSAEQRAQPFRATCAGAAGLTGSAAPGSHCFSYLSNIMSFGNGYHSNYNALQTTLTERATHGLSFTVGYTYAHALDNASDNWGSGLEVPINNTSPTSLQRSVYGNSNFDLRNRLTISTTYMIPGRSGFGQILQGWSINSIWTIEGGTPWGVNDLTNDFSGTGEITNAVQTGDGIGEQWNFFGNPKDFTPVHGWTDTNGGWQSGGGGVPYFPGSGSLTGPATADATCNSHAAALGPLAVAALRNNGCYDVNGSVLIPPAYGTFGTTGRNIFTGPNFRNWDLSVTKQFKFKERLTAQFRAEFFNVLNRPQFTNPFGGPGGGPSGSTDPSQGAGNFGIVTATPDVNSSNSVLGSGGARAMQLGLKLIF